MEYEDENEDYSEEDQEGEDYTDRKNLENEYQDEYLEAEEEINEDEL